MTCIKSNFDADKAKMTVSVYKTRYYNVFSFSRKTRSDSCSFKLKKRWGMGKSGSGMSFNLMLSKCHIFLLTLQLNGIMFNLHWR